MRLVNSKYYYTTVTYEIGDTTVEISAAQYKELRAKFERDISNNKEAYENGKINTLLDTWVNEISLDTYNETRFYICEGSATYVLTKQECKQGYKFGDYS